HVSDLLKCAFADPGNSLLPADPVCYYDQNYILYAMGVLSHHYPDAALRYMKEKIISRGEL
ncbi:MAG TPA: MutL protein, partial [Peptococcaceae bacterium]|nr:MutL protein [Peptococcaceae bacterium]